MEDFDITKLEENSPASSFIGSDLGKIITDVLNVVYPIVGILLLLALLFGGLQLMTSRGDPKAVEGAKQRITNAIIGVIIVFASYWLIQVIIQFLGIQKQAGGIFGL